jgi:hypothetical protein
MSNSRVVDKDDDFSTLYAERDTAGSHPYSFGDGDLRYVFRKDGFFKIDARYYFFRTIANPAAVQRLSGGVGERKTRFSKALLDDYHRVFHEMMAADGIAHIFYDMVKRGETMHEYWQAHQWPTIHCVRLPTEHEIESYIEELHGRRGTELFLKHDAPQFYERACFEALNPPVLDQLASTENLLPVMLEGRGWMVSGAMLKDAVDFLGQLHYSQHMPRSSGFDDD